MKFSNLVVVALIGGAAFTAFQSFGDRPHAPEAELARRTDAGSSRSAERTGVAVPGRAATSAARNAVALTNMRNASAAPAPRQAPVTRTPEAEVVEEAEAVVASGTERVRSAFGYAGSRLVGGSVTRMTTKTERMLNVLAPAAVPISEAPRTQLDSLVHRVRVLDAEAVAQLEDGRPVLALRTAMRGRNLVSSVRNQVRDDSVRQ